MGGAQPCNPNTCFATTFSCTSLVPPSIEFACERSHRRAVFLCAVKHGFRPHAGVFRDADDCEALEQLCRHITRPALANERRHCNAAWSGGSEAEESLARRHDGSGDFADGVHVDAHRTAGLRRPDSMVLRLQWVDLVQPGWPLERSRSEHSSPSRGFGQRPSWSSPMPGPCGPNDPSRSFRNLHGRFAEVRRHGRRLHTRRRPATLESR